MQQLLIRINHLYTNAPPIPFGYEPVKAPVIDDWEVIPQHLQQPVYNQRPEEFKGYQHNDGLGSIFGVDGIDDDVDEVPVSHEQRMSTVLMEHTLKKKEDEKQQKQRILLSLQNKGTSLSLT
jgi:hypothetical protein